MPKRNAGGVMEAMLQSVVRETVRGIRDALPSARQLQRIEERLKELDQRVSRLARTSKRRGGATRGKVGRPRKNPETCTMRGCSEPARARALCSRHYQQRRRTAARKK